jgi:hypothetical protein
MFTLPMALFLSTGAIALFSFLAVAAWSDSRRREREAYYKNESLKKLAEMQGDNAVVAVTREEERNALRRLREGIKLGGLVTAAVGIGVMVFLRALVPVTPVYLAGLIPLLTGVALLVYAYILAPKE